MNFEQGEKESIYMHHDWCVNELEMRHSSRNKVGIRVFVAQIPAESFYVGLDPNYRVF